MAGVPASAQAVEAGVVYRKEDQPGIIRRLLAAGVDITVMGFVSLVVLVMWSVVLGELLPMAPPLFVFAGLAMLWWCYFVLLKWLPVGTLGHLLCGLRVVTLKGEPAGLFRLTFRALVSVGLNSFVDLLWMAGGQRQCLRDQLLGTYVIRKGAVPVGPGRVVYETVFLVGYALAIQKVKADPQGPGTLPVCAKTAAQ